MASFNERNKPSLCGIINARVSEGHWNG